MERVGTAGTAHHHEPVMLAEVVEALRVPPGGVVVDVTLGRGGHAKRVARALGPGGTLLALDTDPAAHQAPTLAWVQEAPCRVVVVDRPFSEVGLALAEAGLGRVDGLLADLGVSSPQLDDPARGFSFQAEGPLDMRMDPRRGEPASALIQRLPQEELAALIRDLGEERHARRVARALQEARPGTTTEAARAVATVVRRSADGLHPATRTFQALRIAVNRELEELAALLAQVPDVLKPGGRVVVLAFHSLEDRLVKQAFHGEEKGCVCPPMLPVCACGRWPRLALTPRRAVRPTEEETARNPRARSARMRVAERLPDPAGKEAGW